jgi:hypothetical protein
MEHIVHSDGFLNETLHLFEDRASLVSAVKRSPARRPPGDQAGINQLPDFALYRSERNLRATG